MAKRAVSATDGTPTAAEPPAAPAKITVRGLSKSFPGKNGTVVAVDDLALTIPAGEFFTVVGPSGCGKTTLLRILAGLESATSGEIVVQDSPTDRPSNAMIFQGDSIFPWMSVWDNAAYGLRMRGVDGAHIREVVGHYLDKTGLSKFSEAYPHQLSGGMKQRVSIARAFANDPDVLLMDEPFSALDEQNKTLLQGELLRIWDETKKTVVYITHSVDEAVTLSDRIMVMTAHPGRAKALIDVPFERHVDERLGTSRVRGHDHDPITERDCLVHAVSDVDDGLLGLVPDAQQLALQQCLVLLVQGGERLVHQQHVGIVGEGTRDRDALLHAAGQLVGIRLGELRQAGLVQVVADHFADVGAVNTAHPQPVGGVVPHRHPREDRVALEDHGVGRPVRRRILHHDLPGGGRLQTGKDAQERGLAAAAGPDDGEELPGRDGQRQVVDRDDGPVLAWEALAEPAHGDLGRGCGGLGGRRRPVSGAHRSLRHLNARFAISTLASPSQRSLRQGMMRREISARSTDIA